MAREGKEYKGKLMKRKRKIGIRLKVTEGSKVRKGKDDREGMSEYTRSLGCQKGR